MVVLLITLKTLVVGMGFDLVFLFSSLISWIPIDLVAICFGRRRWKRSEIELCGRLDPRYQHDLLGLLMQSYHEV